MCIRDRTETNPFLTEFQTEHGVPPFDKIKLEHYEPAFLKGIEEQNANINLKRYLKKLYTNLDRFLKLRSFVRISACSYTFLVLLVCPFMHSVLLCSH